MIENIHKWLVFRLALVWLVLSLMVGSLVGYLGHARLNNHVVNMAQTETFHYISNFIVYLKSPSPQTLALFNRTIQNFIEKDNLIVVEFYGADLKKVTEVIKSSAEEVEKMLPKHGEEFTNASGIICEKLTLGSDLFMRVFVPIVDSAGDKIGYLEGIYHAPDDIVSQNKIEFFWALTLIVVVSFVITLALYPLFIRLNRKLLNYSHILTLTNIGMLKVLGSAIAKRDSDTNIHNFRVALYSVRIGEKMHLSNTAMQGLIKGAFLHDVGKIAIPDAILLKPGKLTREEFEIMKTHVSHGKEILSSYAWLKDADDIVCYHHEKFNGSGYRSGLSGEDIPLNARIFSVVDVFDALTSRRPYKKPFSLETSIDIIREGRGNHFDPEVVDLFIEHAEALYAEICNEDALRLHRKLDECIEGYFG